MPMPTDLTSKCIIRFAGTMLLSGLLICPAAGAPATTDDASSSVVLIPHPHIGLGDVRSEAVASATRLLGLKESFTRDSFARHILFVNGIMEYSSLPAKSWARDLAKKLKKNGILSRKGTPAPGDLVIFGLEPSAPGSINTRNVMVGVVEKVHSDSLTFITAGSKKIIRGSMSLKKGRGKDTKLASCQVTERKKVASKKPPPGSGKKKSGRNTASKSGGSKITTVTKQVPCRASELFAGFADIEAVVRKLGKRPTADRTVTIFDDERPESLED